LGVLLLLGPAFELPHADANDDFFEKQVRPVLADQCVRCHGPTKSSGGLRLDSREAILKGGESGPAAVASKPDESRLVKAIRRHKDVSPMPPDKTLEPSAVAALERWIRDGIAWPAKASPVRAIGHWAFESLRVSTPPGADANPIDAFIHAKLKGKSAGPADKLTLIRRVTFDLIGLPPTPDEVDSFLQDTSTDAYANLIDRLLASPHYGEKWGRKWLDVVRYADTAGETADYPVTDAWRYRNYVIDAFNRDLPYDQFLREQIAGDILAARTPERYAELITATGYLAVSRRFGFDVLKDHFLTLEDTIDTVGKSVLGLSIGCARCHDHKYDPISQQDYYALYGIFESTKYSLPGSEKVKTQRDLVPLVPAAEREKKLAELRERSDRAAKALADLRVKFKRADAKELAKGGFANGGKQDFPVESLRNIAVAKGELIWVTVLPKQNHGADSTRLELEIREGKRVWNIGTLVKDMQGSDGRWRLLDVADGIRSLSEFQTNAEKTPGLVAWRGGADWPAVLVNTTDKPIAWQTVKQPAKSVNLHPGPQGGVAVAWESPIDGKVTLSGHVTDLDSSAGDGIDWTIAKSAGFGGELAAVSDALKSVDVARRAISDYQNSIPTAYAAWEGKPHDAELHKRGDPDTRGAAIPRRFLTVLGGQLLPPGSGSGRLELANWLADVKNPLTARVMVNRIWQEHFGTGLVATPNDFGTRGAPPTHPELLDWLANEFMRSGWSIKAMHRLMLASETYQRTSQRSGEPYSNFVRRRLTAEEIRDAMLAASGDLDRSPGGPHPFPEPKTWQYTQHDPFTAVYESNRRSVYLMQSRLKRHPFLALFDGSDPNASTAGRETTTVPTQALYFLNDPFVHARAEGLTKKLTTVGDPKERLDRACRLLYGRPAREADHKAAERFLSGGGDWPAWLRVMFSSNEFVYLD
jgi:mono/diheme cytochrome c family protein